MSEETAEPVENQKVVIGMIVAVLVIAAVVGGGYLYSKKKSGQTVLPAGYQPPQATAEIDCAQPRQANANIWDYYGKCDPIKFDSNAPTITHTDPTYNFSVLVPKSMNLVPVGNGYGIAYKEIAPNINQLYLYDIAKDRTGELASLTGEDYVRNYWRQYSGLTGIKSLEPLVSGNGVKGFKAIYIIGGAKEGNQEVFFELGEKSGDFAHFTRGIIEQGLYDTIIGSFKYPASGSASTPTPAEE